MKFTGHVAIGQYEYMEVEGESQEEVSEACRAIQREWGAADGIPDKEMNPVIDKMLLGETVEGGIEIYEKMNSTQKYAVQTLKRALKRLEARDGKLQISE